MAELVLAKRHDDDNSGSSAELSRGSLRHAPSSRATNTYATAYPTVESLVETLIAAKRALSIMGAVLRAKELVTTARAEHEDAAILAAQAGFVRRIMVDQVALLVRMRRSLQTTYTSRRGRLDKLSHSMDAAHEKLETLISELKVTTVWDAIRPADEPPKTLFDFVDQQPVDDLLSSMRRSVMDMQVRSFFCGPEIQTLWIQAS